MEPMTMKRAIRVLHTVLLAGLVVPVALAQTPRDVVTVGRVAGWETVDVPVFIRDVSGSPLGVDQPAGSHIQSFSLTVNYSPASAVDSITFSRAGITEALTPAFEVSTSATGTISLIGNFDESTNPIPFTSNRARPGDPVAHLIVNLAPDVPAGTIVVLSLDAGLTILSDEMGSPGTEESVSNGRLALVNGAIIVTQPVPALTPFALLMLAMGLAGAALWIQRL
jgi:hypothetical protein